MFEHILSIHRYTPIQIKPIKQTMKKVVLLMLAVAAAVGAVAQTTWNVDKSHSKIGFITTHMVVAEVDGAFKDFEASVVTKSADFNGAEVTFTAKVASIDTENERRDGHLKSADFFDAEKFPEITFKGNLVKEGTKYKLKGDFTMKGVTKQVEFDVTYGGTVDTGRGIKAGFKLNGTVNRQDYGVSWNNKLAGGELVVSDEVIISCKIELNKAA
jgi:polyisoprenoid-binding protein YceI